MSPLNYYMVRESTTLLYSFELVVVVAAAILVLVLWRATGDARALGAYLVGGLYDSVIELLAAGSGARTVTPVALFGVLPVGFPVLPLILGFFEGGVLVLAAFELTRGVLERDRRALRVGAGIVVALGALITIGAAGTDMPGYLVAHPEARVRTVRALFAPASLLILAASWGLTLAYVFGRGSAGDPKGLLVWYVTLLLAAGVWYTPVFVSGTRRIAALVDGTYQPVGMVEQIAVLYGFSLLFEAAGFYLPVYVLKKAFRSPFDGLRVSGMPYETTVFPLMLSSSKHERPLFHRAAHPGVTILATDEHR